MPFEILIPSWRAKQRAETEPQPEPGMPARPVKLQGEAKRTWTRMCQQLAAVGVLTTVDGEALSRYCTRWARWVAPQADDSPDPEYKRLDKMIRLLAPFLSEIPGHFRLVAPLGGRMKKEHAILPALGMRPDAELAGNVSGRPVKRRAPPRTTPS